MKIFETHAHLNFPQFDNDRDLLLKKCFANGIERIINVGVDKKTSEESIKLAQKYKKISASVGFHPHDAKDFDAEFIRKIAVHPEVVAIGEIGLDYYRNLSPKDVQKNALRKQLEIALDLKLPIIIHDRDAHEDIFQILAEYSPKKVVFHCFSGDEIFAEKVLNAGYFISFTGVVTYKKSQLENVVRMIPNNKFFIETDSPYLSPHPKRGKRNSPLNLRYIIEKIADIKRISPNKIAEFSFDNACDFFGFQKKA